eukprot:scaffold106_cov380-Prasinococcus_capsulatus_cf.AAC.72
MRRGEAELAAAAMDGGRSSQGLVAVRSQVRLERARDAPAGLGRLRRRGWMTEEAAAAGSTRPLRPSFGALYKGRRRAPCCGQCSSYVVARCHGEEALATFRPAGHGKEVSSELVSQGAALTSVRLGGKGYLLYLWLKAQVLSTRPLEELPYAPERLHSHALQPGRILRPAVRQAGASGI